MGKEPIRGKKENPAGPRNVGMCLTEVVTFTFHFLSALRVWCSLMSYVHVCVHVQYILFTLTVTLFCFSLFYSCLPFHGFFSHIHTVLFCGPEVFNQSHPCVPRFGAKLWGLMVSSCGIRWITVNDPQLQTFCPTCFHVQVILCILRPQVTCLQSLYQLYLDSLSHS